MCTSCSRVTSAGGDLLHNEPISCAGVQHIVYAAENGTYRANHSYSCTLLVSCFAISDVTVSELAMQRMQHSITMAFSAY